MGHIDDIWQMNLPTSNDEINLYFIFGLKNDRFNILGLYSPRESTAYVISRSIQRVIGENPAHTAVSIFWMGFCDRFWVAQTQVKEPSLRRSGRQRAQRKNVAQTRNKRMHTCSDSGIDLSTLEKMCEQS